MKKISVLLFLTIILIPSGIARDLNREGDSSTKLGKFNIEIAESPFILNGNKLKTYLVKYENAGFKLKVTIDNSAGDETKFLAISDALSVQYVSHGRYFGVRKIDQKYVSSELETSDIDLNKSEYFHQKVLTSWEVTEFEKVKLIAAYYPSLLKNIDNLIAEK